MTRKDLERAFNDVARQNYELAVHLLAFIDKQPTNTLKPKERAKLNTLKGYFLEFTQGREIRL